MRLSFETLYKNHYEEIKYFILGYTHNVHVSEELTNETFIRVYQNLDKFDETQANIRTWIYTIARNIVIDNHRKHRHNVQSIDEFYSDGECTIDINSNSITPDQQMENIELCDEIKKFIETYRISYQQIFNLRFYDEYSYEEISDELEIPIGTVKGTIHRMTKEIKEKFKLKYLQS